MYTRIPIEGVYWENVGQFTYLKTGQWEGASALLVIPMKNLAGTIKPTQDKDLVIKGIIEGETNCSNQEATSKSLAALKTAHRFLTVTTVDERPYGNESV